MDDTENISAEYQGNPVDVSGENGQAPTSTEHSTDAGESTRETATSTSRESAESTPANQAQVQAQAKIDYEKSYKELEKTYTRDSQRRAQIEREYQKANQLVEQYKRIDQELVKNPEAFAYLQRMLSGQAQVDPVTQNDPLYKHLQPALQKIDQFERYMQGQVQQTQNAQLNMTIDGQVSAAAQEIKAHFNRDMTREDLAKVYTWMAENHCNGKAAVRDLFWDDFGNAKAQSVVANNQAKKGLGTTKTSVVNSNNAKSKADDKPMSFRESWKEARKELGLDS